MEVSQDEKETRLPDEELPEENQEIVSLVDGFQAESTPALIAHFGVSQTQLGSVRSLLRNRGPFKAHPLTLQRQWCQDVKPVLDAIAGTGVYMDAEVNLFFGMNEIVISTTPKSTPKDILDSKGSKIGVLHPGRNERDTLLVVSEHRLHAVLPDTEVDIWSSSGLSAYPSAMVAVHTSDRSLPIPYGYLAFIAEKQRHHRSHFVVSASERFLLQENTKVVDPLDAINSETLGVQAYYDEKGRFVSFGMYMKEGAHSYFGTFLAGDEPREFTHMQTGGVDSDMMYPVSVKHPNSTYQISRLDVSYEFPERIHPPSLIRSLTSALRKKTESIDAEII